MFGNRSEGTTAGLQVFLRAGQMAELDKLRTDLMSSSAVKLQAAARGFIARRRYQRVRKAVLTLQVPPFPPPLLLPPNHNAMLGSVLNLP